MRKERDDCVARGLKAAETWKRLLVAGGGDPPFCKALRHIHRNLKATEQRHRILTCLVDTARAWNPDKVMAQRDAQTRIRDLNRDIAESARVLAEKLESRAALVNNNAVGSNTGLILMECVERFASLPLTGYKRHQHSDPMLVRTYLLPELDNLRGRYGLDYWPDMHGLLTVLATMASEAVPHDQFYDDISQEAMNSREASLLDFLRAFDLRISNEKRVRHGDAGCLPDRFELGPADTAALINAVLEPSDGGISADGVRKHRSRKKADN